MKIKILAVAMVCAIGLMLNASAAETNAPMLVYDRVDGTLMVSGTAEEGSFITFQILTLGSSYEDLKGSEREKAVFYCSQKTAEADGYSFEIDFMGKSGIYKAFVVDLEGNERYEFDIPVVVPDEYAAAVEELNAAAKNGYEEFKNVLSENEFKLGFSFDVKATEQAVENYYEYVKKNNLIVSDAEKNAEIYKSFVLMDALSSGEIDDFTDYIKDIYFENDELYQELVYATELNSDAGEYMTEKLDGVSMTTLDDMEDELETAYVLGIIKYSNGYGDIVEAFEKYGIKFGIKGTISTKACQKMNGNDYEADDIGDVYDDFKGSNSGGSGGGSGSSSNRNPVSASGPSSVMGSGIPDIKAEVTEKMIFTDMSENHWAAEAVLWLREKGIVSGTETGAFEPDRAVTREEFTKMIVLACGFEKEKNSVEFDDVESGAWYEEYVYTAAANSVVNGVGDGLFGTGFKIIRQDMSVMVNRATDICKAELNKARNYNAFADESDISDYAKSSVVRLYECGIINGKGENSFDPMGNATRAEAAKIIYEAFKGGIGE